LYVTIFFFRIRVSSIYSMRYFHCDLDFIILAFRLKMIGYSLIFLFGPSLCSLLHSSKISFLLFKFLLPVYIYVSP
jgi:hypothetical protein